MEDRWDVMNVVCIKEYKTIKIGYHYQIKGRGDLEFNADPEVGGRKGYGYCVEDDKVASDKPRWWTLPYKERIKWYYFTEEEMGEYFITDYENYKMYIRDQKINSVMND